MNILCSAAIRENALFSCRFYTDRKRILTSVTVRKRERRKRQRRKWQESTAESLGKKPNKTKHKNFSLFIFAHFKSFSESLRSAAWRKCWRDGWNGLWKKKEAKGRTTTLTFCTYQKNARRWAGNDGKSSLFWPGDCRRGRRRTTATATALAIITATTIWKAIV